MIAYRFGLLVVVLLLLMPCMAMAQSQPTSLTLSTSTIYRPPNNPYIDQQSQGEGDRDRLSKQALADVLWALLNSSEFFLNH